MSVEAENKPAEPDSLPVMIRKEAWAASAVCCVAAIFAMYLIGRAQFSSFETKQTVRDVALADARKAELAVIEAKLDALANRVPMIQQNQVHVQKPTTREDTIAILTKHYLEQPNAGTLHP